MSSPEQPQWYSGADVQDMINQALAQHAETQAAQQSAQGSMSAAQVQSIVDEALARQAEAHNAAIQALSASMRGSVASMVAEHAGGIGTAIHPTWSQWEQEQAHAAAEAGRRVA